MSKNIRCPWRGIEKNFYEIYHDTEWGLPVLNNDNYLFEMLILEGAQAGLSWETILKKREHYRRLFHHFDPFQVSVMTDEDLETILKNPDIVRNRLKVFSTRKNAIAFLKIQKEFGTFHQYLWNFVQGKTILNHWTDMKEVPTKTPLSDTISKDLKKRGMTFVGSTILYSFLQAVGVVNDHLVSCFCHPKNKSIS